MLKSISNGNSGNNSNRNSKSNSNSNSNRSKWYIGANNLYGYAMMQKFSYKDFKYYITSLDSILKTLDGSDYGYYIVCDVDYNDNRKDKTEQLALMANKRKINDNELGYRERDKLKQEQRD